MSNSTAKPNAGLLPDAEFSTIELWLSTLQQLFNSFDPSPFHEKDLDSEAEDYIVGAVDELGSPQPIRLVIHLPAEQLLSASSLDLEGSVRHYFSYRHSEAERKLRLHFREARAALVIGVLFLVACITLRQLASFVLEEPTARIVQEGLLILGWVAMWGPIQLLLYDWWPLRHRVHLFSRLAAMKVEVRQR